MSFVQSKHKIIFEIGVDFKSKSLNPDWSHVSWLAIGKELFNKS